MTNLYITVCMSWENVCKSSLGATATASSVYDWYYKEANAIDGTTGHYGWASEGDTAVGSWIYIQLSGTHPIFYIRLMNRFGLDRANKAVTLTFSDGSVYYHTVSLSFLNMLSKFSENKCKDIVL